MNLINDFFHIIKIDIHEEDIELLLRLNKEHVIFRSHFPGQPIVPGVCQVAIVVESMQKLENRTLQLSAAKNIKFLNVISPDNVCDITILISRIKRVTDGLSFAAVFKNDETTFSKFSLTCSYTKTYDKR